MEKDKLKKLTLTAMFMAMCCVTTMFLSVPSVGGYTNLGDAFVLLGALLLGPWYGAAAGGVGSALADLLAGYGYYVPGTLVIKGIVAMIAGLMLHRLPLGESHPLAAAGIGVSVGELWMVAGYWLYKSLILGNAAGALTSIPKNLIQAAACAAMSLVMYAALRKILKSR